MFLKIVINEVASSEQVFAKDSDLVLLGLVKFDYQRRLNLKI
jgi:hypothetical protein